MNGNNIAINNIDDTWKTVKANYGSNVNNKVNNRRFNSTDVSNKYKHIFIHENEVTEPYINNRMNNDVDKCKNAFNNNIDNNVTIHKRRLTGYTKYNETVRFGPKGTSMVKGIRRNEFNSCLKKCNTRFRPFIGATIKQMET